MPRIAFYDPAGCCATGVCDPTTSDQMAQYASAIESLVKQEGVEVERYNLGTQPGAFAENEMIKQALEDDGVECLPLVVVDGDIVSKGAYLGKSELGEKIGIEITGAAESSSCCG